MSSNKAATHSFGDRLTLFTLVFILLVGAGVLAGWHLRIRALVQVFPGIIPMQYNTALCFIALAVSALASVKIWRRSVALQLAGASFAAAMGALVAFQYATGISLGIDTAFFYPWDRTLSAHPGRMALTSAISFAFAGGALVLLAVRPRALAAFAVAHTLPLSFGLTSLLGYLLGITYVLPFRLGSQMAFHTALLFTAYGGVMLGHAWKIAPRCGEGLPKWGPGIAAVMLPVLFVAFSALSPVGTASSAGVQVLFAVAGSALLGYAIYRMASVRIAYKGLILIGIPLVFVLGFVVLVTAMKRSSEQAQAWASRSNELIDQALTLSNRLVEAEAGVRGHVISGDPAFAEPYTRAALEMPVILGLIEDLTRDDPRAQATVGRLGQRAVRRLEHLSGLEKLMRAGAREEAIVDIKGGTGRQLMKEFQEEMASFLQEEKRLNAARRLTVEESWQRFNWLLAAGASADILLASMLAFVFSRSISSRLRVLTKNAQLLTAGEKLAEPLSGVDEIAQLDGVFHRMAAALEEAAKKERAVVEHAADVILSVDAEGKFIKISPASLKVWGYAPEELIGRSFTELVAADDVAETEQTVALIRAGEQMAEFENRCHRKDGAEIYVLWSASWSESEGLMFCVARDITRRKLAEEGLRRLHDELEARVEKRTAELSKANALLEKQIVERSRAEEELRASEQRHRLLVEGVRDYAIFMLDEVGRVASWNVGGERIYGYTAEEIVGQHVSVFFTPEDVEDGKPWHELKMVAEEGRSEYEAWRTGKDGTWFWANVVTTAIRDEGGGLRGYSKVTRDVTERKRAEQEIRKLNTELEQRVVERTAQLEAANKELEAFSYSVSHDLRAPLRATNGFSRILLEEYAPEMPADAQRYLRMVQENAQQMGRLIDDLLAFSRLSRQALQKQRVAPDAVVRQVLEDLAPETEGRRVEVSIGDLPACQADPSLLRQVFVNLISNALKYTRGREASRVEVGSLNGGEAEGGPVYFVRDNGAGFDMQYAHKLFGVFQRLHRAEEFEGTGVGLAIVQRIVNRHGGRVWAEAEVGKGATFYFTLDGEAFL